jgi:hypothetical protein
LEVIFSSNREDNEDSEDLDKRQNIDNIHLSFREHSSIILDIAFISSREDIQENAADREDRED